jgi:DNA-binding response OmpR family regulator
MDMETQDIIQLLAYLVLLTACTPVLGGFMAKVLTGEPTTLTSWLAPLERWIYRAAGCDPLTEMRWTTYAGALLAFNGCGLVAVLALQLAQGILPLNPQHLPGVPWGLALNTAVSFVTNTNWQAYSGEATLSCLTQMLGLTVQNFVSAATGIAVLLALARGFARRGLATVGNFWADAVRAVVYVLLPLSVVLALVLVAQGVVQTLSPYVTATTLEGGTQTLPLGPAASQIAIKQLGTNGGGFFGANSAHPFENPTPLTNFLEMLAILLIPAALTYTYGRLVGSRRQGWVLFAAMLALFLVGLAVATLPAFALYSQRAAGQSHAVTLSVTVLVALLVCLIPTTIGGLLSAIGISAEHLAEAAMRRPAVVILDLGLPDTDGLEVLKHLREWSTVPIIVLSVRDGDTDKIAALDSGADDYVTKPFSSGELLARLRVAQRHVQAGDDTVVFRTGNLDVDLATRQVRVGGQVVHLTVTEYGLLRLLVRHAGRVLTHGQILREVWGPGYTEQTHYLRVYMAHLRSKLEAVPASPKLLLTEPGVGYRLAIRE